MVWGFMQPVNLAVVIALACSKYFFGWSWETISLVGLMVPVAVVGLRAFSALLRGELDAFLGLE